MRGRSTLLLGGLVALLVALLVAFGAQSRALAQLDAGVPPPDAAGDAGPRGVGPPGLVPPRLIGTAALELPLGTPPVPEGAAVELVLTIDASGAVTDAQIGAPFREDVDSLVLDAAWRLRFTPATRDGAPTPARIRFRFTLPRPAAPVAVDAGLPPADAGPPPPPRDAGPPDAGSTSAVLIEPSDTLPEAFGARAVVVPPDPGAATRVTLTGEEITTVPGTFGEPLRVVAALPGVVHSPFGVGYFFVRGASFENTGFFVDGFPVPILYHLGAGPAVISSRLVERLDFYPGGYPVSFGRFNAGVIALTTAPPPADRVRLEVELDLFRASALAVVPLPDDRGSVAVAFRRSYYELLLPLLVDGIDLSFTDYQLRADVKITRRLRSSIFIFGSNDGLDSSQAVGSGETAGQQQTGLDYDFLRVIGKLELRLPNRIRAAWSGMTGFDATTIRSRSPGTSDLALEARATWLAQRIDLRWQPTERLRTSGGVDLAANVITVDAQLPNPPGFGEYPRPIFSPETFSLSSHAVQLAAAAHVEQMFRVGWFEMTGGLRLDHYTYGTTSALAFDPRGVIRLHASDHVVIKAATGMFAQPPQPFQLLAALGDTELPPNRSWQSSAGVELSLPHQIEIESQGFYSFMSGLARPGQALVTEPDGTVRRQFFFGDGEGRSYGLELLVRRKVERGLYGWLSYTLSRSERFVENGEVVPFNFDQTHVLNLAASYAVGRWRFGVRFQLATGRPVNGVRGAIYDADMDGYDPERSGLTERLPVYHQLDARIDYRFPLGPFDAGIYIDGINIYNAENAEGYIYQYDFQKRERAPGLPFLATVGFRLTY